MKIVSIPYLLTQKANDDDWLQYEGTTEDAAYQKGMMLEEEIRALNSDFNYKHYGQFNEEKSSEIADLKRGEETMMKFAMLQKMWNKV